MGDDKNAGRQADIASPQTTDFISNVWQEIGPNLSPLLFKKSPRLFLSGAQENKFQRVYHLKVKAKKRNCAGEVCRSRRRMPSLMNQTLFCSLCIRLVIPPGGPKLRI